MTGIWPMTLDANDLSTYDLAAALEAGAAHEPWGRRAAIVLLLNKRSWLDRYEFRQAVAVEVDSEGRLCAWMDWGGIDTTTAGSSGDFVMLEVACYLAGVPWGRPLPELLGDLDEYDLCRIVAAVNIAALREPEDLP